MESKSNNTAWFVVVGLLLALLCCLCIVIVAAAGAFLAVQRAATAAPLVITLQVSTPSGLERSTPTPASRPGIGKTQAVSEQAEAMLAQLAEVEVPTADPISLAERFQGKVNIPTVLATSAPTLKVGQTQKFWASDVDNNNNFQITADLVDVTPHVYFWVEQGVNYSLSDVESLVDTFEAHAYPTDREFFGSEWTPGVDGDPHLYILYATGLGGSIAGYFSSNDEFSPEAHEYSNGHEMFYLSADNLTDLNDDFTNGVLAHEFQHMIHWYRDRNEETWMNEGFSELAAYLNGYSVGGFDFSYILQPDLTLTYWPSEPGTAGAHYGQAFLFLKYFLDRFGAEATKALVANPANGLDSIDQTLAGLGETDPLTGAPITADDLARDWGVTLLLQDSSVGDGRYAMSDYSGFVKAQPGETISDCPGDPLSGDVSQYGVDYIQINCRGDYRLAFQGDVSARVVPADAHSGDYAFWSNRGDESDMTLTRTFDLTAVQDPGDFDYWVWYDLEAGYDYLYLEASVDGGQTWQIVTTPSGTGDNPSGNAYGWGYNGESGGGSQAEWINEKVDLSPYAGKELTLRFEYITDAAVNGEGFLLDDVSIPALNYQQGFEQGDGGWESQGWVRLYNEIPQTYRVVLVEEGSAPKVREIALDPSNHGEIDLSLGSANDNAVLVVIGTARHTWQEAPYQVQITP
jgi:immune inhibitor A